MSNITFKTKVKTMYNMDNSIAYQYLSVPALKRSHCDMRSFRIHPKYGAYANSDFFEGMLNKIKADKFYNGIIKLDNIPDGVIVDTSGFLASVSFDV
jgi:hypothetical protein